jgi:hypothetical protein
MREIHRAAAQADLESLKFILKKSTSINLKDEGGKTALMYAAQKGHRKIVKALLKKGARVDMKDKHGCTAILKAASIGRSEIVKALLDLFIKNGRKKAIANFLINQDSLETYRDPGSKYGKKPLIQEVLKLIDEKKEGLDKKSLFVRLFGINISLKISSHLRMIDIINLSQVSKQSKPKPIFFSSQQTGEALSSFSPLPLDEGKEKKTNGKG